MYVLDLCNLLPQDIVYLKSLIGFFLNEDSTSI